jgi:hypothetical protein
MNLMRLRDFYRGASDYGWAFAIVAVVGLALLYYSI